MPWLRSTWPIYFMASDSESILKEFMLAKDDNDTYPGQSLQALEEAFYRVTYNLSDFVESAHAVVNDLDFTNKSATEEVVKERIEWITSFTGLGRCFI